MEKKTALHCLDPINPCAWKKRKSGVEKRKRDHMGKRKEVRTTIVLIWSKRWRSAIKFITLTALFDGVELTLATSDLEPFVLRQLWPWRIHFCYCLSSLGHFFKQTPRHKNLDQTRTRPDRPSPSSLPYPPFSPRPSRSICERSRRKSRRKNTGTSRREVARSKLNIIRFF